MHDNSGRLGLGHDVIIDNVKILDGFVLGRVVESFPEEKASPSATSRNGNIFALTAGLGSRKGHRSYQPPGPSWRTLTIEYRPWMPPA